MENNLFNSFRKYSVHAESLQEFCEVWHKPGKITDYNREADYENHKADLEKYGYTFIPASSSTTGRIVSYYGRI